MERRGSVAFGVAIIAAPLLLQGCSATAEGDPHFLSASGPVNDFILPVQSLEERRFLSVVRQRYDFSCGSAALATLLHHHYRDPRTEVEVFQGMWRDGDRAQIRRVGFSLLDMKRYLAARGIRADGYKVPLEEIANRGVPGIALITLKGYRHFVVVKGVTDEEVLVGDPSLGLRTMAVPEFTKAWNGIYFVINSDLAKAKTTFNSDAQWANFSRAPIGGRFAEPVSLQALMLTAPFYRDF